MSQTPSFVTLVGYVSVVFRRHRVFYPLGDVSYFYTMESDEQVRAIIGQPNIPESLGIPHYPCYVVVLKSNLNIVDHLGLSFDPFYWVIDQGDHDHFERFVFPHLHKDPVPLRWQLLLKHYEELLQVFQYHPLLGSEVPRSRDSFERHLEELVEGKKKKRKRAAPP